MQCAARSSGRVALNDPRNDFASAVRELITTTASLIYSLKNAPESNINQRARRCSRVQLHGENDASRNFSAAHFFQYGIRFVQGTRRHLAMQLAFSRQRQNVLQVFTRADS